MSQNFDYRGFRVVPSLQDGNEITMSRGQVLFTGSEDSVKADIDNFLQTSRMPRRQPGDILVPKAETQRQHRKRKASKEVISRNLVARIRDITTQEEVRELASAILNF